MNEYLLIVLGGVLIAAVSLYFMNERYRREIVRELVKGQVSNPVDLRIRLRIYRPDENGAFRIDAYVPTDSKPIPAGMEWRTIVTAHDAYHLNDSMIELVQSGDFVVDAVYPANKPFLNKKSYERE